MRAVITYHGGKSYWFGKTRFKLDIPVSVTDPATINHCEQTAGFTVNHAVPQDPAPKVERESVKPLVRKKKIRRVTAADE